MFLSKASQYNILLFCFLKPVSMSNIDLFNYFCALSFHAVTTFKCATWKHDPNRLCVNMSDHDIQAHRRAQVIKHRTNSGAGVKGPCSSQNGHKVRVREGGWRSQFKGGERRWWRAILGGGEDKKK